jgi:hypothetical protein
LKPSHVDNFRARWSYFVDVVCDWRPRYYGVGASVSSITIELSEWQTGPVASNIAVAEMFLATVSSPTANVTDRASLLANQGLITLTPTVSGVDLVLVVNPVTTNNTYYYAFYVVSILQSTSPLELGTFCSSNNQVSMVDQ